MFLLCVSVTFASETDGAIVTGGNNGFAWSDQAGWVNFGVVNGNIHITDSGITGYAWIPNYGWMNMSPTNGGVLVSSTGVLSGYAWSTGLGWVNFSGVSINSSGKFVGQATGSGIGTLTFDCTNCSVSTDYRFSSTRTDSSGDISSGGLGALVAPVAPASAAPSPTGQAIEPPTGEVPPTEVGVAEGEDVAEAEGELLPDELFDIRLVIDRRTITSIRDLVARTTFESFGRVPTPVDLTFSIVDAQGNIVYSKKDNVVIQTEGVLVSRFTDVADLPDGEYMLRAHTLYNVDVEDNFEIPFTINAGEKTGFGAWWIWVLVAVFGAGLLILFRYAFVRRRCAKCRKDRTCEVCIAQKLCNRCDQEEHRAHQMIVR